MKDMFGMFGLGADGKVYKIEAETVELYLLTQVDADTTTVIAKNKDFILRTAHSIKMIKKDGHYRFVLGND